MTDSRGHHAIDTSLVDPQMLRQLEGFLEHFGPRGFGSIDDLDERRSVYEELGRAASERAPDAAVSRRDIELPSQPPLTARLYEPEGGGNGAGLLYIHGGGMIMGSAAAEDSHAARLAAGTGATTVAVDYRLAPQWPYPAGVDDCTAALNWLHQAGDELGVDPERIAVYGVSGGGALAAALALRWRERLEPSIALLALAAPMLDDRTQTQGGQPVLGVWDAEHNTEAWSHVLQGRAGDVVTADMAPGRARDLSGMPATHIDVGSLDLFLAEDLRFAGALASAGVPIELHVHPGAYHGFDQMAPGAAATRRAWDLRIQALRSALRSS